MPKLYFKYGTMGRSKSAQALMTKFNYEQKGFRVLLLKPSIDTRDNTQGKTIIASRIGLSSEALTFDENENLIKFYLNKNNENQYSVVIVDEAQFCSTHQIEELKEISNLVPVLCFGLKTNFKSYLFEGSKRLLEIADSITEIKNICSCGKKAIINARFINGEIACEGDEIMMGGDNEYKALCFNCWSHLCKKKRLSKLKNIKI